MPSAPLFPFQEAPGKAEPGNQEVPRRDTSCRRRYGNGPRLPQGGSPGTPPPRRQPRPPHRPPTVAAAAAAAAILARAASPCLPGGTCAALALPSGALPLGCRRRPTAQAPLRKRGSAGPASPRDCSRTTHGLGPMLCLTPGGGRQSGEPFAAGTHLLAGLETLPTALGFLLDSVSSSVIPYLLHGVGPCTSKCMCVHNESVNRVALLLTQVTQVSYQAFMPSVQISTTLSRLPCARAFSCLRKKNVFSLAHHS